MDSNKIQHYIQYLLLHTNSSTCHEVVFCVAMLCTDVVRYQHFRGPYCLQNVGILPHHYMVSQPRRLQHESSSLWKLEVSQRSYFETSSKPNLNYGKWFTYYKQILIKFNTKTLIKCKYKKILFDFLSYSVMQCQLHSWNISFFRISVRRWKKTILWTTQ